MLVTPNDRWVTPPPHQESMCHLSMDRQRVRVGVSGFPWYDGTSWAREVVPQQVVNGGDMSSDVWLSVQSQG